jgi:endoglucanase
MFGSGLTTAPDQLDEHRSCCRPKSLPPGAREVSQAWAKRILLGASLALASLVVGAVPPSVLEQRMQLFRDGALRGFALAELPENGREVYTESDFDELAATGANVVRVPILLKKCKGCERFDPPEPDIRYAERVLSRGERLGFRVVVVLLATPWGNESDYWNSESLKADIVTQWGQVARRLKGYAALQAYDLINEPVVPGASRESGLVQWHALASRIAREVRAVDPDTPLMFEPAPWALPGSFWQTQPLAMPGVVYSFHLYAPHEFTHQGLPGYAEARTYPGAGWDKARLVQEMLEAREFASAHQVPMFVGEFSCVRWAPEGSCPRYLIDALSLFEAQGWGWAYHCWRCYQGWDNPTVLLLKKAMERSSKSARP